MTPIIALFQDVWNTFQISIQNKNFAKVRSMSQAMLFISVAYGVIAGCFAKLFFLFVFSYINPHEPSSSYIFAESYFCYICMANPVSFTYLFLLFVYDKKAKVLCIYACTMWLIPMWFNYIYQWSLTAFLSGLFWGRIVSLIFAFYEFHNIQGESDFKTLQPLQI